MDLSAVLSWFQRLAVPALTSTGLTIAALFGAFKWFGKKWIEGRISEAQQQRQAVFTRQQGELLEAFKGEQNQNVEALKAEYQKEFERFRVLLTTRSKIQEKEFNFLAQAWVMLNDLDSSVRRAMNVGFKSLPSFKTFSKAQLESFLSEPPVNRLSDYQKDQIRTAADYKEQEKIYWKVMNDLDCNNAFENNRLLLNSLIEHRIFMTEDLQEKFNAAQKALYSAFTGYSIGKDGGDRQLVQDAYMKFDKTIPDLIAEVEKAIQVRLQGA